MDTSAYKGLCSVTEACPTANHQYPENALGTVATLEDGRTYVYCKAAEGLVLGDALVTKPAFAAEVSNVASDTDKKVLTPASSPSWTVNAYANAWAVVTAGTGAFQCARKIKSNTATALTLYEALTTALDTSDSKVTVISPWYVEKSAVTSKIQTSIAVAQNTVTSGYYFWALKNSQYSNFCPAVYVGGTQVVGTLMAAGDDTEGRLIKLTTENVGEANPYGIALTVATADTLTAALI